MLIHTWHERMSKLVCVYGELWGRNGLGDLEVDSGVECSMAHRI